MINFNNIFGTFCCILLFWGCNVKKDEDLSITYELEKVRIEIYSSTSRSSRGMQQVFLNKETEYYVHGDKSRFTLLFFDLEQEKLDFEIPLERDGPNGITSFNGFFIKNLDSIYVYYGYTYTMWHLNFKGEILKKYQWAFDNNIDGILLNPYGEEVLIDGNRVYLPASPNLNPSEFWKGYVSQSLNLDDGKVAFNTKYPEINSVLNKK
ncbi:DUF4221 family protein [Cecembia calidifontis]|uniref:Uncharacterized protein DUF4221 n=1 Tax=Cecembia calidifontis TaxID=1187080 RepID=A0A4Q7P8M7_9BACT|nr:DUF4221 family protein [Cecembia calidifontis]RZS96474.1 uncharacterized protein DUF4221 [Cecembia calidifontis]